MQIEQAYDKVVLTNQEVQDALRKAVEEKTNRRVRGHVVVNHETNKVVGGPNSSPHTTGSAYCYLEPGVIVATIEK